MGEKLAADFEQLHPGVRINFTDLPDFDAKMLAALAASTPPDLSYTDRFRTRTWACKGGASVLDA